MKLLSIVLLSILALIGCGQQSDVVQDTNIFTSVDPQLQPYFDQFAQLTGTSTSGITAGFTSLGSNVAGECVFDGPYREVRIDPNAWNTYGWTNDQKQQLLAHELGHCALYLQHINNCASLSDPNGQIVYVDGTMSPCNQGNGSPSSIMNWMMFNSLQASYFVTVNQAQYYQYLKLNAPIP